MRPLEKEDADLLRRWRFAEANYAYFYEFVPTSRMQNEAWLENTLRKSSEINFIVTENVEGRDIGMISLIDIDMRNRKCEMGRVLIADENSRGKGIGQQVIEMLLEYAFQHLNMHKVYCEVFADNEAAVRLYQKCGFEKDGLFEKHIYKNGAYKDVIHMSIIK